MRLHCGGRATATKAWLHAEGQARERVKLAKLRVERRLLTLLDDAQTSKSGPSFNLR